MDLLIINHGSMILAQSTLATGKIQVTIAFLKVFTASISLISRGIKSQKLEPRKAIFLVT